MRLRSTHAAPALGDKLHALLDQRQHPQRQEVDLDHARVVHRVLVPLADVAAGHAPLLDGHQLGDRLRGDDHPAHVLREVTREAVDLAPPACTRSRQRGASALWRNSGSDAISSARSSACRASTRFASLSSSASGSPSALPTSRTAERSL